MRGGTAVISGPFFRRRDTDPARCVDCGADVTRGDLWGVPLRKGGAVTGLCYACARRVADEQR